MPRTLQPEILDSLPPDDPEAVRSRGDLRVINGVMGNHRWVLGEIARLRRPGERVLEIGAGTGDLLLALAAGAVAADGLDLAPAPQGLPAGSAWHQSDVRSFEGIGNYPIVVANLFLHHLTEADLRAMGGRIAGSARVVIACEPSRSRVAALLAWGYGMASGFGPVTRHDAQVSIRAGFLGSELPVTLGLEPPAWSVACRETGRGAYRMTAVRAG
jgi:hypothetical protein